MLSVFISSAPISVATRLSNIVSVNFVALHKSQLSSHSQTLSVTHTAFYIKLATDDGTLDVPLSVTRPNDTK